MNLRSLFQRLASGQRRWFPRWIAIGLFVILGLLGNLYSITLFFGVDFVFGSTAAFLAIRALGPAAGVFVAFCAGSYTCLLWNHPYGWLIFSCEAIFCAALLRRTQLDTVALDALFWAIAGAPLAWLAYSLQMQMDELSAGVVVLKQSVNGIFNALIAEALWFSAVLASRCRWTRLPQRTVSFRNTLYLLTVAAILIPSILATIVTGRSEHRNIVRSAEANLKMVMKQVQLRVVRWYDQHMHAVQILAELAAQRADQGSSMLQSATEAVTRLFPEFHNMYVADATGRTIAFYPATNEKGESTIGLDFSDRNYYHQVKLTRKPVVSEVFAGRGGVFVPIQTLCSPVIQDGEFTGFALGAVNLSRLERSLAADFELGAVDLVVLDPFGRVVTSNSKEFRTLELSVLPKQIPEGKTVTWTPEYANALPTLVAWERSHYVHTLSLGPALPLQVLVRTPVQPFRDRLFGFYLRQLSVTAIVALIGIVTARKLSAVITAPLARLAKQTKDFPSVIHQAHLPDFKVHEAITETSELAANFQSMAAVLKAKFAETQERSHQILAINAKLEAEIAERCHAEAQIADLIQLIDHSPDAIIVLGDDDAIQFWNGGAEALFHLAEEQAINRRLGDLLPKSRAALAVMKQALASAQYWSGELRHNPQEKPGEVILYARCAALTSSGMPRRTLIIASDITEKKSLESQVLRAQRLDSLGTLAGGVAHDLNNILAPILISAELLQAGSRQDTAKKYIDTIHASAKRGIEIVQQVLDFARGRDADHAELPLRELLKDLLRIIRETFPKSIRIQAHVPADLWPVAGNITHIYQAFLNLCINARDAMPAGGNLTITAENAPVVAFTDSRDSSVGETCTYVLVKITDTGVGIPPENLDRIFDPFFTTKQEGHGTGLGLSTVRTIVQKHQGKITAESIPEVGTTFSVYLPAALKVASTHRVEDSQHVERGSGEWILVVDDERPVREMLQQALLRYGYNVLVAEDGADALQMMAQHGDKVQLAITDLMMPFMDGIVLLHCIKKVNAHTKLILCSGLGPDFGLQHRIEDLQRLGAFSFLRKPYTLHALLSSIRDELNRDPIKIDASL